jgi:hypothetical protein
VLTVATVVATLLRLRARACVVLACVAALLCTASIASAKPGAQPKTRVWDFSFAEPLNIRLDAPANAETHPAISPSQPKLASASPHAARAVPGAGRVLSEAIPEAQRVLLRQLFRAGGKGGIEGSNAALKAIRAGDLSVVPQGLTRTTLEQYLQIARAAPPTQTGVQQVRIEIIEALLKVMK